MLIGSVLGILSCIFGCVSIANNYNKKYPAEKLPIRTLLIQIEEDHREELFTQLRKFSEKHNFEVYLSFYKNKEVVYVDMDGKTLEISALTVPGAPQKIDIAFYETDPTNPPSQETVNEVFNDLKAFISEIPNVKIIEEK